MDSTTLTTIVTAIITAAAGSFATWLKFRTSEHKSAEGVARELMDQCRELQATITQRDARIGELQQQLKELTQEVESLKQMVEKYQSTAVHSDSTQILETLMQTMPHPAWIHEVGQNQWFINDTYSKRLNVHRNDFWDAVNVYRFYPAERAASFVANDMAVIQSGATHCFTEEFPDRILEPASNDNQKREWQVVKFPVVAGGKRYVIGMCHRPEDVPRSIFDSVCGTD